MNLETFQKNFRINDINIKPYLIVVSILLSIILIIIFFNYKLEDYYICYGKVIDNKVKVSVKYENLERITNNKQIIIERHVFTYKVVEIKEINESLYYELTLEFNKVPTNIFIDNNIIKIKVIINKTTIFDYFIKTLRGNDI